MTSNPGGIPSTQPSKGGGLPHPCTAYGLKGPQVQPDGSYWTEGPCPLPRIIDVADLLAITDHESPSNPWFFPPYPSDQETAKEIAELHELAKLRDDPSKLAGTEPGKERSPISRFLQLRPQPLGAVINQKHPAPPTLPPVNEKCEVLLANAHHYPVILTGRELARWFEAETPGLGHRHALNCLIKDANISPLQQARIWMALDVTIHSALLACWHYKWRSARERVAYRPRPYECDLSLSILYDREVSADGSGDGAPRTFPSPSPGSPRHPAYPAGHSTVGGAASEILSCFFPAYRGDFDDLADNSGMARLWAGIHYRSDHIQGLKLGRAVARLVIAQLEADGVPKPVIGAKPDPSNTNPPPTKAQIRQKSFEFAKACAGGALDAKTSVCSQPPAGAAPSTTLDEEAIKQSRSPQQGAQ